MKKSERWLNIKEFLKLFADKTIKESHSHHLLSIYVLLFSEKIGFLGASTTKKRISIV
jgi:hypothetical protein